MNQENNVSAQIQIVVGAVGGYGEYMARETYHALPPRLRGSIRWLGFDVDDTTNDFAPHLPKFSTFGKKHILSGSQTRHLLAKIRAEGLYALPEFPALVQSIQALEDGQISRVYTALQKQSGAGQIRVVGATAFAANLPEISRLLDDTFSELRAQQTSAGKCKLILLAGSAGAVGSGGTPVLGSWLTQQIGYQDVEVSVIIGSPRHLLRPAMRENYDQQEKTLAANADAMLKECEALTQATADTRAVFDHVYLIDAVNDAGTPLAGLREHAGLCGAFGAALIGGLGAHLSGTAQTNEEAMPGTITAVGCATLHIPPELEDHARAAAKITLIEASLRSPTAAVMAPHLPTVPSTGAALPMLAQDKESLKALMADPAALTGALEEAQKQIDAELAKATATQASGLDSFAAQCETSLRRFVVTNLQHGLPSVQAAFGVLKEDLTRRKERRQRDREIAQKSRDLLKAGAQRVLTSPGSWFASRAQLQVRHFDQWRAACEAWRSAEWEMRSIDRALGVLDTGAKHLGEIMQAASAAKAMAESEMRRARSMPITARLMPALPPESWPTSPAEKITAPDYPSMQTLTWSALETVLLTSAHQAVQTLMAGLSLSKIDHPPGCSGRLKSGSSVLARRRAGAQHDRREESYFVGEHAGVSRDSDVAKMLTLETGRRFTWVQLLRGLKVASLHRTKADARAYYERRHYLHVVAAPEEVEPMVAHVESTATHRRTG